MEVPAGKLKVMERFFSPIHQQGLERGGASNEVDLRGGDVMEGRNYALFYSSLSSTSLSSETSVEGNTFTAHLQLGSRKHSRSCVDVWTSRESNVDSGCPAYSNSSNRSEDRLCREEVKGHVNAPLHRPGNLDQSAELPTCREHQRKPEPRALPNGLSTDNLRRSRSMEVVASEPSGQAAKGLAAPGALRDGRKLKGDPRAGLELMPAKARLVQQKVKFSQFLDEITTQVLSPASIDFLGLKLQDRGVRGDGNAGKNCSVGAGATQDGQAWREEKPVQHRRERRSISPEDCRQPGNQGTAEAAAGPRCGSRRQRGGEGPRPTDGEGGPERSPRQTPSAARRHFEPSGAPPGPARPLEPEQAPPKQGSPASRHRRGEGGGGELTDSASSFEGCPAHPGRPGPRKGTDSSSSPEEPWPTEGLSHEAGRPGSGTSSTGAKELLTDVHRLKFLQEENDGLQRHLACTTYRMEKMDSDFKASHGYLETELQRARLDLQDLREKFRRLQESYSSTQQVNELMGEKLHMISQNMETERTDLKQQISELTNRLINAQRTICTLENINPPHQIAPLVPERVTQRGHDQLQADVDHALFLNVPVFTPPAPFMDQGPGMDAEAPDHPDCPIPSAVVSTPVAEKPQCRVGAVPDDNALHRPEEQIFTPGHEEPTRPSRASATSGPHRHTAFTPWRLCLRDNSPIEWLETVRGNWPQAAGGKPEERRPSSADRFAACPADPFGPIEPEEHLPPALSAAGEGSQSEFTLKRPFRKEVNLKPHHLVGEVGLSSGCEGEAVDSWNKTFEGKGPADAVRGQELNYCPLLSGLAKTFQRNGSATPHGSDGKATKGDIGNCSPSLGPLGVSCDPSAQHSLSGIEHWVNPWGEEIGCQLLEVGRGSHNDDATWRPLEGGRAIGGQEHVRGGPEATTRARPSSQHRLATAPRKHSSQATCGPAARE